MKGNKFKSQSGGQMWTPHGATRGVSDSASKVSGKSFLKPTLQTIVGVATLLLAIAAQGQSVWNATNGTWNSNGSGNEWTPNGVPTSSTVVHFGSTAVAPTTVIATVKGKSVVSAGAIIGVDSGRTATVNVEDQGSAGVWTASGDMYVGMAGTGTLTIHDGGEVVVSTGGGIIGQATGSVGTVNVTGTGAQWTMSTGGLTVANLGQGSLTISGGGVVNTALAALIGSNSGGNGTVQVTGAGSLLSSATGVIVSRGGIGQLTIENSGRVLAQTVNITLLASGAGTLNLNGTAGARGVLEVNSVQGGAGTEAFNIDGGILKARTTGNLISNFEAGDIQVLSGGAIIEVGTGISANMSSALQGAGGVTKTGVGSLTFNGTDANSYNGTTVVQDGTLVLDRAAADSGTVKNLEVGDGTGAAGSAVVRLDKSEQIKNDASVTIKSDGSFNLNGKNETVGTLVNQGGTFTTGAGKLTGTGASVTWAGGTNTINSGGSVEDAHVVISGGTNTVEGGGNLVVLAGGAGLEINNASLTLNSSNTTAGNLTLRSSVTSTGNASIATAGVGANAGTVNLDGGTRDFNVASGQLSVSANITNGGLTKLGTGTMLASGTSTYAGATTVSNGTLNVSGSLSQTSSVVVANGGTLMLSGAAGSSKINDTASITLQSGSTLAFAAGLSNHTETVGTLTLSGNSIIDLGVGGANNILQFALSGAASWNGTLSIYNYNLGDRIYFGTQDNPTSLTAGQLNSIQFYSGAGTGLLGIGQWTGSNTGEVTFGSGEIMPVPEPATVMSALLLLGIVCWSERSWFTRRGAMRLRLQAA
jgi:T5SS/PEP-CTERM-associated repeat protein/autotransporter-associated beta strand protein